MIRVGILGAAGYTGGELIRLLINHPECEIIFANSGSNSGKKICDVHEGLIGETELEFTSDLPFDSVDVIFFCFGHGKSAEFLATHAIPPKVKIIDLAQDFRISSPGNDFVYGLPEIHRDSIMSCNHLANPGCFATCIQLGLLPLAKLGLLVNDVSVNALTGSTGAGQSPTPSTHFSWRNGNISTYKVFNHQHLHEIRQSLSELQGSLDCSIDFIPYRGDFARGIFCTSVVKLNGAEGSRWNPTGDELANSYKAFYSNSPFTHYVDHGIDLKQVVNTNKALVHIDKFGNKAVVTSVIDNLLKGAVGQAVENMNLMFGLDETCGLKLKALAF